MSQSAEEEKFAMKQKIYEKLSIKDRVKIPAKTRGVPFDKFYYIIIFYFIWKLTYTCTILNDL